MKKCLLMAAVALMTASSASAVNWFISGKFQGWSHCNANYQLKEKTSGVFELEVASAPDAFAGEFLICQGNVGSPDFNNKIGTNGSKIKVDEPYKYTKGAGNFNIDGEIAYPVVITLDTNAGTLLLSGKTKENEYDTVYVVGDISGSGWNENLTNYPLTLKAGTNNVWEGEYSFSTTSYLKFKAGSALYGNGKDYGTDTNITLGKSEVVYDYGQSYVLSAGTYHIELTLDKNATTASLLVTGPSVVTFPDELYIIGCVNQGEFAYNNGYKMTNEGDGIYTAENVLINGSLGSEDGYFSFTEALGKTGWSDMGMRYGATSNDFVVTLDQELTLKAGENAFKIAGNKSYNLTVNLDEMTLVVEAVNNPEPVKPELTPEDVTATEVTADVEDFTCTWTDGSDTEEPGLVITGKAPQGATSVEIEIAIPEGFDSCYVGNLGGVPEEGLSLKAALEGTWVPAAAAQELGMVKTNKVNVPADNQTYEYPIMFGLGDEVFYTPMFLSATIESATTGVEGVEVEAAEAVYYNLQGVQVANPENGVFVKVVNGKAVKVVL